MYFILDQNPTGNNISFDELEELIPKKDDSNWEVFELGEKYQLFQSQEWRGYQLVMVELYMIYNNFIGGSIRFRYGSVTGQLAQALAEYKYISEVQHILQKIDEWQEQVNGTELVEAGLTFYGLFEDSSPLKEFVDAYDDVII